MSAYNMGSSLRFTVYADGLLLISGSGKMDNHSFLEYYLGEGSSHRHDLSAEEAEKIITRVRIEEGVTHIGKSFFSGLTNLKEVEIADSVTSIGEEAFSSCKSLEAIAIPDGVT